MSVTVHVLCICHFVFFNDTATTEIYTLSLHDASSDLVLTQFVSGTIDAKTTGFAIYLLGAFISGFSVCILNTVVNPMLNLLGGGGNRGNQLNMIGGTLNSLSGTLTPLFVGALKIGRASCR